MREKFRLHLVQTVQRDSQETTMPKKPNSAASPLDQMSQDPAQDAVLKLYKQDFDRWEFTETHPRIAPFCETLARLGNPDVA